MKTFRIKIIKWLKYKKWNMMERYTLMMIKTQYLKMEILSKLICKFNATIIKISTEFSCREINKM